MLTCIQFMSDDKATIDGLYQRYAGDQLESLQPTAPLIEGQGLTQQMFPEDFVRHLTDTNIYFLRIRD